MSAISTAARSFTPTKRSALPPRPARRRCSRAENSVRFIPRSYRRSGFTPPRNTIRIITRRTRYAIASTAAIADATRGSRKSEGIKLVPCELSSRCQANRAVQAYHLAVEHVIFKDVLDQLGVILRRPQARGEGHTGGQ